MLKKIACYAAIAVCMYIAMDILIKTGREIGRNER